MRTTCLILRTHIHFNEVLISEPKSGRCDGHIWPLNPMICYAINLYQQSANPRDSASQRFVSSTGNVEVLLSHIHSIVCAYNIRDLFLKFQSPVRRQHIIIRMETNGKSWKKEQCELLTKYLKIGNIYCHLW